MNWEEAKKLGMECPHGNLIGWCDSCSKDYVDYVKTFINRCLSDQKSRIRKVIEDAGTKDVMEWNFREGYDQLRYDLLNDPEFSPDSDRKPL